MECQGDTFENYQHKIDAFNAAIAELEATSDMEPVPDGEYDAPYVAKHVLVVRGQQIQIVSPDKKYLISAVDIPSGWQLMRPREVSDGD